MKGIEQFRLCMSETSLQDGRLFVYCNQLVSFILRVSISFPSTTSVYRYMPALSSFALMVSNDSPLLLSRYCFIKVPCISNTRSACVIVPGPGIIRRLAIRIVAVGSDERC